MKEIKGFKEFLARAKANTYAAAGDEGGETLPDGAKVLTYEEGDFFYTDTYFGFDPFCGQEIVRYKGKVVWTMNYYGGLTITPEEADPGAPYLDASSVYDSLRVALNHPLPHCPYRGPGYWHTPGDAFWYYNKWQGTLAKFQGTEKIYRFHEELVYELHYHGGFVN